MAVVLGGGQGRNEGGKGGAIPRALSHYGGAKSLLGAQNNCGAPKSPKNVTNTSFNTVHLLPENLNL